MTLKSEQEVTDAVLQQLEQADSQLSDQVRQDIALARRKAIVQARSSEASKQPWLARLVRWVQQHIYITTAPIAVAMAVVILLSYQSVENLPVMPVELVSADVPMEDLALLEDLEFAHWLSQQQEVLN